MHIYQPRKIPSNILILLWMFCLSLQVNQAQADGENEISVVVRVVKPTKAIKRELAKVNIGDFGSGLAFRKQGRKGKHTLYTVSDKLLPTDDKRSAKRASVGPQVGIISVKDDEVVLEQLVPVLNTPTSNAQLSVPIDELDLEGVAPGVGEALWVCDEAIQALIQINSVSGVISDVALPGDGLPEELSDVQENRGLEGVSVAPNGDVFIAVQSTLEAENGEANAQFTRLVEYDPYTRTSKVYAYPLESDRYARTADAKIGGIQTVDSERLLVIEQGQQSDGEYGNRVYLISVAGATDLEKLPDHGRRLESASEPSALFGSGGEITPVSKELLLDLRAFGWKADKAEGVTLLSDGRTVIVSAEGDVREAEMELWYFELPEALIGWGTKEWVLITILLLIFLGGTVVMIVGIMPTPKKGADGQS